MKLNLSFSICLIVLLGLVVGCSADPAPLQKSALATQTDMAALKTTIQQQKVVIDGLTTQNKDLVTKIDALQKQVAQVATKDDVAKAVAATVLPAEWAQVKAVANTASGQVLQLQSQFQSQINLQNKGMSDFVNYINQQLPTLYATKGDIISYQLRNDDLDARLKVIEQKLGLR